MVLLKDIEFEGNGKKDLCGGAERQSGEKLRAKRGFSGF